MITVQKIVRFGDGRRRKRRQPVAQGRVPRVARLMALAIRFDRMISGGVVADQAELARLGQVTRARLTQIMNLLALASDLQEQIVFLPPSERGRNRVSERDLRPIAASPSWSKQRQMWQRLLRAAGSDAVHDC